MEKLTNEEIKRSKDLQIKVTPAVEDAFYFIHAAVHDATALTEAQIKCRDRLIKDYPQKEAHDAIDVALKMIGNIEKYGIACAEWA